MFNVACRPKGVKTKIKKENPNFTIYYLPIRATRWDAGAFRQLLFLVRFGYYSLIKLIKIHQKYRIDLIHCDNPAVSGLIAVILKKIFKIPFIYLQHGLDSHFKLNFILEIKQIFPKSANYIIVSRRMIPFFKKNKLDINKLTWVPVGIEFNKFFHAKNEEEKKKLISELNLTSIVNEDDFIIIYVGYMDLKQKTLGMIDFLYGFNKFLAEMSIEQRKKVKLLYLGDGKYRKQLKNEINNLKLNENAFLLGIKLDIEKFYAISDFLALTSYIEGFPIVLLEAIASNVPCICTDVGEVNEILDQESIIPCGQRDEIASKLKLFYENKDLCDQVLRSSYDKIKKFDWDIITENIKEIYRKGILDSKTN